MTPEELAAIHRLQLMLALEFRDLCDRHSIQYFLIAGTLLGAVRHGGFIPWDDDMDFGMHRSDYERFKMIAASELKPPFFLQTWDTDPNFGLPLAKIRLDGTRMAEENARDVSAHQGVYIDIFPFDSTPRLETIRSIQKHASYLLFRLILAKSRYSNSTTPSCLKRTTFRFLRFAAIPLSGRALRHAFQSVMTLGNSRSSDQIVAIGGSYGYDRETIERAWVSTVVQMPFEGHNFSAPAKWHEYLTHMYGDYRRPPAPNLRGGRHGVTSVYLGRWSDQID